MTTYQAVLHLLERIRELEKELAAARREAYNWRYQHLELWDPGQ